MFIALQRSLFLLSDLPSLLGSSDMGVEPLHPKPPLLMGGAGEVGWNRMNPLQAFDIIVVRGVPRFASSDENAARRFASMVDILHLGRCSKRFVRSDSFSGEPCQ